MPTPPDPFEAIIAGKRANNDQVIASWEEHIRKLIEAYRANLGKFERSDLLQMSINTLMADESNDREALCIQVMTLVDYVARKGR